MGNSIRNELLAFAEEAKAKKAVDLCRNKEQQTKNSLVEPYIRLLGFDPSDALQVRVEYQTATVHTPDHVDYALMDVNNPVAFVEAKSLGHREVANSTRMNKQLRSYMLDSASVKFGALTDGQHWLWYYKEDNHDDPILFLTVDVLADSQDESIVEWASRLRQRDTVNEMLTVARTMSLAAKIRGWFADSLKSPSDSLSRLLLKEIGEPNTGKARLRQCKHGWKRAMRSISNYSSVPSGDTPSVGPKPPIPIDPPSGKACVLQCSNSGNEIYPNATQLLIGVVRYCAKNHKNGVQDYHNRIKKPLAGTRKWSAWISEEEFGSLASPTERYSSMSDDGYHVFNHMPNTRKVDFINALLGECILASGATPKIDRELRIHLPNSSLQISDLKSES